MIFDQKEIDLLNAAYQIFVGRTHIFDVLSAEKWQNTGMENWVQIELTVGLVDRDYDVSTTGKRARHCDLIVKKSSIGLDVGVELKAFTYPWYEGFVNEGLRKHPTDLYLFIFQHDPSDQEHTQVLNKLEDYLKKNKYIKECRKLNNWIIMLVKKEGILKN